MIDPSTIEPSFKKTDSAFRGDADTIEIIKTAAAAVINFRDILTFMLSSLKKIQLPAKQFHSDIYVM